MYKICPKCAYERSPADAGHPGICPACGLVFAKWAQNLGMIQRERQIAWCADALGTIMVLAALSWGGHVLYRQYRNLPGKQESL